MNTFKMMMSVGDKFNERLFVESWTDKEKSTRCKFVPLTAQFVYDELCTDYAMDAQNLMNKASEDGDIKLWRLYHYICANAFAVVKKYGNKMRIKPKFELETKRFMANKFDAALEVLTVQYDAMRLHISARTPFAKELRKIYPEFVTVFDALSDRAEKLHKSINREWHEERKNESNCNK